MECAGTDATEAFEDVGHSERAWAAMESLVVGKIPVNVRRRFFVLIMSPSFQNLSLEDAANVKNSSRNNAKK